jgi:hypothetical protein
MSFAAINPALIAE